MPRSHSFSKVDASVKAGVEPRYRDWNGHGSLVDFVVSLNLVRRHLNESQRATIGARVKPKYEEEAKERQGSRTDLRANLPGSPGSEHRSRDDAARAVNVSSIVAGEYAENEIRKDFTVSERVAIKRTIEEEIGERQGSRTDKQLVGVCPQVEPGEKTREYAAQRAGFSSDRTGRRAEAVINQGSPELIASVDAGTVSLHAAEALSNLPQTSLSKNRNPLTNRYP